MFDVFFNKSLRYAVRSSQWKKVRQEHLKEFSKCAVCGKTKDLEVHHIQPVHLKPELELDPENLITLCSNSCHLLFGHLMDFKSWNPKIIEDALAFKNRISKRPYK